MKESQVEARLHSKLLDIGGLSWKIAPVTKGIPDRLVILPGGRIYLIELKAIGGRLSPAQRLWHSRAADRGVTVVVLTGKDEVDQWIEEHTT